MKNEKPSGVLKLDSENESGLKEIVNYFCVPEMSYEEKKKMYSVLKKSKLIDMLIEANLHIDSFLKEQKYITLTGNDLVHFPSDVYSNRTDV